MKKIVFFVTLLFAFSVIVLPECLSEEKNNTKNLPKDVSKYLQDTSVTIHAGRSQGSGTIFTREGINYIWTAAHVIADLRKTREVIDSRSGVRKTIVEFDDAKIVKELVEDGRSVGRLTMDAEVIRYSNAVTGEDLALLRVRKKNFVKETTIFYTEKAIPPVGTKLFHCGSLLGQMGSNSVTSGIISQHGRVIGNLVYDQTTCPAFPGSCLPANMLINMADGTKKPIIHVKVGEKVLSFNNKVETGTVIAFLKAGIKPIFEINTGNSKLLASDNHPVAKFSSKNSFVWTRADALKEGDSIAVMDGDNCKSQKVLSIKYLPAEPTYDITVNKFHNFFADGVLVHNSGGGVYLEDGRYCGMVVRGAGETFNLIVPQRRMLDWAKKTGIEFTLNPNIKCPSKKELERFPVEDDLTGEFPSKQKEEESVKKMIFRKQ